MNCRPGDLCIVVGEVAGCEVNIGALVRVTRRIDFEMTSWEFEDASRPVLMVPMPGEEGAPCWTSSTVESLQSGRYGVFFDRHLLPVRPPAVDAERQASAPKETVHA